MKGIPKWEANAGRGGSKSGREGSAAGKSGSKIMAGIGGPEWKDGDPKSSEAMGRGEVIGRMVEGGARTEAGRRTQVAETVLRTGWMWSPKREGEAATGGKEAEQEGRSPMGRVPLQVQRRA